MDLDTPLPSPPTGHRGYEFVKAASGLPVEVPDALEREPGVEGQFRLAPETVEDYSDEPDGRLNGKVGRVEVFHAERWGTVCDDGFSRAETSRFIVELDADGNATDNVTESEHDNNAPALVCKAMGYDNGEYASGYGQPGPSQRSGPGMTYYPVGSTYSPGGPQPIWLDELTCAAGDADLRVDALPAPLAHCAYAGWGLHNCTHNEDAGVRCWNDEPASAEAGARALKARFVSPPEHHDGSRRVRVRVAFSEAIDESPKTVGEHGVKVEGGRVTSVRRVDNQPAEGAAARSAGRSSGGQEDGPEDGEQVWEFEIEPGSDDGPAGDRPARASFLFIVRPRLRPHPPHRKATKPSRRANPPPTFGHHPR